MNIFRDIQCKTETDLKRGRKLSRSRQRTKTTICESPPRTATRRSQKSSGTSLCWLKNRNKVESRWRICRARQCVKPDDWLRCTYAISQIRRNQCSSKRKEPSSGYSRFPGASFDKISIRDHRRTPDRSPLGSTGQAGVEPKLMRWGRS